MEGGSRAAGADVGSSISAGSIVPSDAGGTETRGRIHSFHHVRIQWPHRYSRL